MTGTRGDEGAARGTDVAAGEEKQEGGGQDGGSAAAREVQQQGAGQARSHSHGAGWGGAGSLRAGLWPLAVVVGVLACALAGSVPNPREGPAIGAQRYTVNTTELRAARELWGLQGDEAGEAVLETAERLAETFVLSEEKEKDQGLAVFLRESADETATPTARLVSHLKHILFWSLQRYIGWSRPDASGFVGRRLHVASEQQFRALIGEAGLGGIGRDGTGPATILDIGSGSGTETLKLAAALGVEPPHVTCLESSGSMRTVLAARGFRVSGSLDGAGDGRPFAAASLLNVLDRCDEPRSLLAAAVGLVRPGGLVLVASALPWHPIVHEGRVGSTWRKSSSRSPRSPLSVHSRARRRKATFELGAAAVAAAAFPPDSGLEVAAWTRLPYVSSGDGRRTHYVMDMALFALRAPQGAGSLERGSYGEEGGGGGGEPPKPSDPLVPEGKPPAACEKKKPDAIYSWLAGRLAAEGRGGGWGDVLDAGAGLGSVCWLLGQAFGTLTAVTASDSGTYGLGSLAAAASSGGRAQVVLGNWRDAGLLEGRTFDVVVGDYLLGAVEKEWPYGAGRVLDRLLDSVRPGGYLLIVGIEPYEGVLSPESRQDRLVLDIERLGDAAAALSGKASYRELPEDWVTDRIARRGGFRVVASKRFPMTLSARSLRKQLSYARTSAREVADGGLQGAVLKRADQLEGGLWWFGRHQNARNYAIVAQRGGG